MKFVEGASLLSRFRFRPNGLSNLVGRSAVDRGMRITSGKVVIKKDDGNLIGISIGGGAPLCPCLYVVQVFDNTPAAKDGTLESGDEIVGVNGTNVKGKTKVEVAKMIQNTSEKVTISYNKLHADPKQGKSLDIVLKKVKHKMVENMSSSTADALGLSRAILCNDSLIKKLEELQRTEEMYRGLVNHSRRVLMGYFDLIRVCKELGDEFYKIGVREPQKSANEAFCEFGEYHRQMEKFGISMLKQTKPILSDLGTYLTKAIPDTKLTIKRYADVKFEYLSYCLKVKELDDEDYSYQALQEPLYRVETGNYEYRLILRCRADARKRFAALRSDVLVKLELLDNKHVQDIVHQLRRLMESLTTFHLDCHKMFDGVKLFPIEVDLEKTAFQYSSSTFTEADETGAEAVADEKLINMFKEDSRDLLSINEENNSNLAGRNNDTNLTENQGKGSSNLLKGLDSGGFEDVDLISDLGTTENSIANLNLNGGHQPLISLPSSVDPPPEEIDEWSLSAPVDDANLLLH